MEMLNTEYDMYAKSLQWQLIENKLLETYEIQVTQDDVLVHAKKLIGMQMKQYGQPNADEKQLQYKKEQHDEEANNMGTKIVVIKLKNDANVERNLVLTYTQ